MNDKDFEKLLSDSLKMYGEEYIDDSEIDDTPHIFKSSFEYDDTKIKHRRKLTVKTAIALIIAAMLAAAATAVGVSAIIEKISRLKIENNSYADYIFTGGEDERKETELRNYQLVDPPFGLVLVDEGYDDENDPQQHFFDYENDDIHVSIDEAKGMHNGSRAGFIVETECEREIIKYNNMELYYYIAPIGMYTLLWEENGNFLCLDVTFKNEVDFTKEDIIKIFESVQNIE